MYCSLLIPIYCTRASFFKNFLEVRLLPTRTKGVQKSLYIVIKEVVAALKRTKDPNFLFHILEITLAASENYNVLKLLLYPMLVAANPVRQ